MCDVRSGVRGALAQLIGPRAGLAALVASAALTLIAATPAPRQSPPPEPVGNALTEAQMKALSPKVALHTEYIVATNKLGQVTGAKAAKQCKDSAFNVQTYGNALQAFIRTEDGKAIPGLYKLTYDYDPKTHRVRRDVALVRAGGVDANAKGAAIVMMDAAHKEAAARKEAAGRAAKTGHAAAVPPATPAASGH